MNIKSLSSHNIEEPESGFLYIVATPIGNLNDISLRAIHVLKNVSFIACEDTRQTQKIMNKFEIKNNLVSFNDHNSLNKIPKIIYKLKSGKSIAIVSDAGMPSICDPGENLIKQAKSEGINLICIPGPSAVTTALVSSGLPSSEFIFYGFVPKKKSEREKLFLEISYSNKTTIFFESPYRLKKSLGELKNICGGLREIQVSRELTKKFEENIGNNINEVIEYFENKEVKGEITVVIKGKKNTNQKSLFDEFELKKELQNLILAGLSLSQASKYLAKKYNLKKNIIYNLH